MFRPRRCLNQQEDRRNNRRTLWNRPLLHQPSNTRRILKPLQRHERHLRAHDFDGLTHLIYSERRLKTAWDFPKVRPTIARREYKTPLRFFRVGYAMYSFPPVRLRYFIIGTFSNPFLSFSLLGYLLAGIKRRQRYYIETLKILKIW